MARDRLGVSDTASKWASEATDVVMWQIAQTRSHQSSSCPHSQPKQVSAPSGKYFPFLANNRESSDIHPRESLSSFQESLSLGSWYRVFVASYLGVSLPLSLDSTPLTSNLSLTLDCLRRASSTLFKIDIVCIINCLSLYRHIRQILFKFFDAFLIEF